MLRDWAFEVEVVRLAASRPLNRAAVDGYSSEGDELGGRLPPDASSSTRSTRP